MASLLDNIMQQLSFFLHQRLSSVAQEMLVQVERALTLALDQERPQSPYVQTPVPAAPEADKTFIDGNQPMIHPTLGAPYNLKQEFVCDSRVDQSSEAQDCDAEEAEDPIQELEGFIQPISEDEDNDDDDVNATTATVKLETDFDSYSDDSNDPSWVKNGAKSLLEKNTESEQPVITQEINVTQSEEKPFSCDFCGKGFKHKFHLTAHRRIHTGERLHHCNICSKSFVYVGHLTIHKRSHTGERPYQCDMCSKSFTHTGSLNNHKRSHTEERPFQCDVCNKSFTQSGLLRTHKLLEHT